MANDALIVAMEAKLTKFQSEMRRAGLIAEKTVSDIEDRFSKANPTFAFTDNFIKGALAGAGIDKIARGFLEANKEVASFGETSRRVGLDLAKFQEIRLAGAAKGIDGKTVDSGLNGLAEKLNEAKNTENSLTERLEANNLKYKDRKGEIISTNVALEQAAQLISNASSEQQKFKIAEDFGLPKEFIPLLENGVEALRRAGEAARESGSIIDSEMVARAKQFDEAWASGWASFASNAKSAVVSAAQGLSSLISAAGEFLSKVNAANDAQARGYSAERAARVNAARDTALANAGGRDVLAAERSNAARAGFRASEADFVNRSQSTVTPPSRPIGTLPTGDPTKDPPKKGGGGGGGGGVDKRGDEIDRYIKTLERQSRILEAEKATLGLSNAERAKAIELARIGTVTDEEQKNKLSEIVAKNVELRDAITKVKEAQDQAKQSTQFFGNIAVDSLSDLILNGAKAEDVFKNIAKSIANAALKAALLGQGPLAGLFGTAGTSGNIGGIFSLFSSTAGKASGGPVRPGQAYTVGENGRETFVPNTPGTIIPAGRGGGGGSVFAPVINAPGADRAQLQVVQKQLADLNRNFDRRVMAASQTASLRNTRA